MRFSLSKSIVWGSSHDYNVGKPRDSCPRPKHVAPYQVDPWQSDEDEVEDAEADAADEQDPLRGERVHAWVRNVMDDCTVFRFFIEIP